MAGRKNEKHGYYGTPTYACHHNMLQRCLNKNHPLWKWYGGRGIKVCDRWRYSFLAFLEDVGEKPTSPNGLSIDRIDNDGNYEPGNVRWVTQAEQCRNRRPRRSDWIIERGGVSKPLYQWCPLVGVKYHTVLHRISAGWPKEHWLAPTGSSLRSLGSAKIKLEDLHEL